MKAVDLARLDAIAEAEGIVTEASADPNQLFMLLLERIARALGAWNPDVDGGAVFDAGAILLGLAAVLSVLLVARALWPAAVALLGRLRNGPRPAAPGAVVVEALAAEVDPEAALEEALAAGDTRLALRRLWEALTRRLAVAGLGVVSHAATHREFLRRARAAAPEWPRHAELSAFARAIERALFCSAPPSRDEVQALRQRARGLTT